MAKEKYRKLDVENRNSEIDAPNATEYTYTVFGIMFG